MNVQGYALPRLPDFLTLVPVVKSGEDVGKYVRLAMMTAMLSVCFEVFPYFFNPRFFHWFPSIVLPTAAVVVLAATMSERYSRVAVAVFSLAFMYEFYLVWAGAANHFWLVMWTVVCASLVPRWWENPVYADYLRVTLGVVMLGAAAQKLLAGTYLDGAFIAYLSHYGSTTENMFQFLCSDQTLQNPCGWHIFLGTFILVWQIVVGLLLIAGLKSLIFLIIEVGFLLGAGLYADEMNFQVLNIAVLCIAFRVGMSYGVFALCTVLLIIDHHSIGDFIDYIL